MARELEAYLGLAHTLRLEEVLVCYSLIEHLDTLRCHVLSGQLLVPGYVDRVYLPPCSSLRLARRRRVQARSRFAALGCRSPSSSGTATAFLAGQLRSGFNIDATYLHDNRCLLSHSAYPPPLAQWQSPAGPESSSLSHGSARVPTSAASGARKTHRHCYRSRAHHR